MPAGNCEEEMDCWIIAGEKPCGEFMKIGLVSMKPDVPGLIGTWPTKSDQAISCNFSKETGCRT